MIRTLTGNVSRIIKIITDNNWKEINQSISEQIEEHQLATSKDSIIESSHFLQKYNTEWRIKKGNLYLTKITSFENLELMPSVTSSEGNNPK